MKRGVVVITDRGGHLHNALQLLEQMELRPDCLLTSRGPELGWLRETFSRVWLIPYQFSWWFRVRKWNFFKALALCLLSLAYVIRLRPRWVISLGASDVVYFCYWARLFGARIVHVECMNQVTTPSLTGRLLYPICHRLFVQWEELRVAYGPKAEYAGWVLS